MSPILEALLSGVAPVLASALATLALYGIHQGAKWLKAKTHAETVDVLEGMATMAVQATEQTVVDPMKASGTWGDPAAWKKAGDEALATFKVLAVAQIPYLIASGVTDIDGYLKPMLEAKLKASEPAAYIVTPEAARQLGLPAGVNVLGAKLAPAGA